MPFKRLGRPARLSAMMLAALAGPPLGAAEPAQVSWGKAGITYEDYLRDSIECGLKGYLLDIEGTRQVEVLRKATSRLENMDGMAGSAPPAGSAGAGIDPMAGAVDHARQAELIRATARADKQMEELRAQMERAVADCLSERGYSRFALDDTQRQRLAVLKPGTDARRRFLHSLAADAGVLERQALESG